MEELARSNYYSLIIVTTLNHFGKGIWKLASILIGIIGGYIVALCFGMVDFSSVAQAAIFQLPKPMHFGIKFEPSSCVALGILFAINSVQAIGDFSATTTGSMDRMPTDTELSGGIVGYGISIFLRIFRWTSDSNLQPECRYCIYNKSYQPQSAWELLLQF